MLQVSGVDKQTGGTNEISSSSILLVQGAVARASEHKKQVSFDNQVEEFGGDGQEASRELGTDFAAGVQGAVAFVQDVFTNAERLNRSVKFVKETVEDFNYPGRQRKHTAEKAKEAPLEDILPPSLGAGYVFLPDVSPLEGNANAMRIIFKIDSGCDPYCIVSRRVVQESKLVVWKQRTVLNLAHKDAKPVVSEEAVRFLLRVTIADRPRLVPIYAVVWEDGACGHDLLVSLTVAVKTGLSIFVHDNLLREVILGRAALHAEGKHDTLGAPDAVVGTILGEEADEDLQERISPIDGLRAALKGPPEMTDDPLVNEELRGPLKDVFGPLFKDPAKVPPLEFSVDMEAVKTKTYKNSAPLRMPSASPRQCDVLGAQFKELKDLGVMADAYPDYPPGPIACMAFTVPKPGVVKLPRPEGYGSSQIFDENMKKIHEEYTASLSQDRLVVNEQPLNEVLLLQQYPLPSVQSNLAKLSKFKVFAKADITKAFWAIPLHPNSRKWTYTVAAGGLSGIWLRAPMGAAPVPAYFMWCLHGVLNAAGCGDFVVLYADDVLIGAQDEQELKRNVKAVLKALLEANFRINANKCSFTPAREISYLGWIIGNGQVRAAPGALDKLWRIRKPNEEVKLKDDKAKRQVVRRFLGVLQYLSHYIPCGAEQLRPLYELTKTANEGEGGGKDYKPPQATTKESKRSQAASSSRPFKWTAECDKAWDWAVARMQEIQPLHTPTYDLNSWLETISDASKYGWGGILVEFRVGDPKPYLIACVSGTFTPAQVNWPVCQKEMLGIWATIKKLRHFLYLHPFVIGMDHRNLLWGSMSTNEVVVRLSTDLQQHRFVMRHVDGPSNVLADYVSRAEHVSIEEFDRLRAREGASKELQAQSISATGALAKGDVTMDPRGAGKDPGKSVSSGSHQSESSCASIFLSSHSSEEVDLKILPGGHESHEADTEAWSEDSVFLLSERNGDSDRGEATVDSETEDEERGMVAPIVLGPAEANGNAAQAVPAPARRQRRRRTAEERAARRRQPEPNLDADRGALREDDGLPIPHMQPQPNPPPNRLSAERFHLIKEFHGGVLPHTGVVNLLAALQEAGHNWPDMEDDCRAFVARCHYCQLDRLTRRGPEALPYRSVEIPSCLGETWHFDILGPLPPCVLSGSRYVMIGVEETSRMTMLGHSIEQSTVEAMFFFLDTFKVFGIPGTISTDKGAPLVSRAVKEFCEATGIKHKIGVPENHQSDAIVEGVGARVIWQYLRTMAWELQKFHAWTPLLCQVQLAANSLRRQSLGGASASELMFGRRLRPMRFLRPEALRRVDGSAAQSGRLQVNTFIADHAALQLRLLGRAEAERHKRYQNNVEEFKESMVGFEGMDWVQVGHLVSIPQPNHERFNRPNKWALLRRGPYEVMEAEGTTLRLRDRNAHVEGRSPKSFQWPRRWVFPYHVLNEEAREEIEPPPPEEGDLPDLELLVEQSMISAVVGEERLDLLAVPAQPRDVRNYRYLVRWSGCDHSANSWEHYETVWHTAAFAEFHAGWQGAVGHVPPSQYAQRHRNHVNALVRGRSAAAADAAVLLPHAGHNVAMMQGYTPLKAVQPQHQRHKDAVQASQDAGQVLSQQQFQDVDSEEDFS